MDGYLQVNSSNQDPSPITPIVGPPLRQQYAYHHPPLPSAPPNDSSTPLRFIDSNPRPAKSPRHVAPPELPSNAPHQPYPEYGTRFAAPYEAMPSRAPEYFPTTLPMQPWTSGAEAGPGSVYGTSSHPPQHHPQHNYEFPSEQYVKEEQGSQGQGQGPNHYTWNPA